MILALWGLYLRSPSHKVPPPCRPQARDSYDSGPSGMRPRQGCPTAGCHEGAPLWEGACFLTWKQAHRSYTTCSLEMDHISAMRILFKLVVSCPQENIQEKPTPSFILITYREWSNLFHIVAKIGKENPSVNQLKFWMCPISKTKSNSLWLLLLLL